jgi:hypothetical protein
VPEKKGQLRSAGGENRELTGETALRLSRISTNL